MLALSDPQTEGAFAVSKWLHLPLRLSAEKLEQFLALAPYIFPLGRIIPEVAECRDDLSAAAITADLEALYAVRAAKGYIIRPRKPVIQVRTHRYRIAGGEVLQNVCGEGTQEWGYNFSFPKLFRDPHTMESIDVQGPNWELFRTMQKWVRHHTMPATFDIEGKNVRSTLRIEK